MNVDVSVDRLGYVVAFERVHAHFAAVAAELDLAPMQAKALYELDVEQPISMRELARRLGADPSNVTGLIDRLEVLERILAASSD